MAVSYTHLDVYKRQFLFISVSFTLDCEDELHGSIYSTLQEGSQIKLKSIVNQHLNEQCKKQFNVLFVFWIKIRLFFIIVCLPYLFYSIFTNIFEM